MAHLDDSKKELGAEDQMKIDEYVRLTHLEFAKAGRRSGIDLDAYLSGEADIPSMRGRFPTVGQINCEAAKSHCFHQMKRTEERPDEWVAFCCKCAVVRDGMEINIPPKGPHGDYLNMVPIEKWRKDHPEAYAD